MPTPLQYSDSLETYLSELDKSTPLSREEEVRLARKGDDKSLEKLVTANLKFVVTTARKYQHQGLELEDLINEGNLGLIEAAQKFDTNKGFKFITYAVWWIRQKILKAIREKGRAIRFPDNKCVALDRARKDRQRFEQESSREVSMDEFSDGLDTLPYCVSIDSGNTPINTGLSKESSRSTVEYHLSDSRSVPADIALERADLSEDLSFLMSFYSKRDRLIIGKIFGLHGHEKRLLREIGEELGICRERVRQLRDQFFRRVRESRHGKILKEYLSEEAKCQ